MDKFIKYLEKLDANTYNKIRSKTDKSIENIIKKINLNIFSSLEPSVKEIYICLDYYISNQSISKLKMLKDLPFFKDEFEILVDQLRKIPSLKGNNDINIWKFNYYALRQAVFISNLLSRENPENTRICLFLIITYLIRCLRKKIVLYYDQNNEAIIGNIFYSSLDEVSKSESIFSLEKKILNNSPENILLIENAQKIKDIAKQDLSYMQSTQPLSYYNNHMINHMETIIRNCFQLLGGKQTDIKLDPQEYFILYVSAWLHDIGSGIYKFPPFYEKMEYFSSNPVAGFDKYNDLIREIHNLRSAIYIERKHKNEEKESVNDLIKNIDTDFMIKIQYIIWKHQSTGMKYYIQDKSVFRKNILKNIDEDPKYIKHKCTREKYKSLLENTMDIFLQYKNDTENTIELIASILKIADELDKSKSCIPPEYIRIANNVPLKQKSHYFRSKLVDRVTISQKDSIDYINITFYINVPDKYDENDPIIKECKRILSVNYFYRTSKNQNPNKHPSEQDIQSIFSCHKKILDQMEYEINDWNKNNINSEFFKKKDLSYTHPDGLDYMNKTNIQLNKQFKKMYGCYIKMVNKFKIKSIQKWKKEKIEKNLISYIHYFIFIKVFVKVATEFEKIKIVEKNINKSNYYPFYEPKNNIFTKHGLNYKLFLICNGKKFEKPIYTFMEMG